MSGVVPGLSVSLDLRRWQLLAGGRVVTSEVWVTLRDSPASQLCEASHSPSAGFGRSKCGDREELL